MMVHYQTLAQRIQTEIEEIERTQATIQRQWNSPRSGHKSAKTFRPFRNF